MSLFIVHHQVTDVSGRMLTGVRGGGGRGGGGTGGGGGGRGGGGRPARAASEVKRGEGAERSSASRSVRSIPERKTSSPLGVRPQLPHTRTDTHTQVTGNMRKNAPKWTFWGFFLVFFFPPRSASFLLRVPAARNSHLGGLKRKKKKKVWEVHVGAEGFEFSGRRGEICEEVRAQVGGLRKRKRQQRVSRLRPCAAPPPKTPQGVFIPVTPSSLLSFTLK